MSELTEAEGLLRAGAMYPRRIGLASDAGPLTLVGVKHGGFSIYFGDMPFYHFDLAGRWQRVLLDHAHYLKALDGSVEAIERLREGDNLVLHRRRLNYAETTDLDASVRRMAIDLASALDADKLVLVPPEPPGIPLDPLELRSLLDLVLHWDASAWFAHREDYLAAFQPIGFVPPDAHLALCLQATLGHARGVAFGGGLALPSSIRTHQEFRQHARAVRKVWGARLLQVRSVYLGGVDTFRLPADDIQQYLQSITELFRLSDDDRPLRPVWLGDQEIHIDAVHGFLDDFSPPLPRADDWKRFGAIHLKRMTLGIDSFDEQTRRRLGSTWSQDDLALAVAEIKQGRIQVSLALLVGAGPVSERDRRIEAAAQTVRSLPLGKGDRLFLIDATEVGGDGLTHRLSSLNLALPTSAEIESERETLKNALNDVRRQSGFQVLSYTTDKQRQ